MTMRMRAETRARLERELFKKKLAFVGLGLAVIGFAAVGFWWTDLDSAVDIRRIGGDVEAINPMPVSRSLVEGVSVSVKLDDGRHVTVAALKSRHLAVGDHIEVSEHHHHSGRTTFTMK